MCLYRGCVQTQHQDVCGRQSEMDEVSQLAQSLLEVNSDARVSHNITQLSTKYQTLSSTSKVSQGFRPGREEGYNSLGHGPVYKTKSLSSLKRCNIYEIKNNICYSCVVDHTCITNMGVLM